MFQEIQAVPFVEGARPDVEAILAHELQAELLELGILSAVVPHRFHEDNVVPWSQEVGFYFEEDLVIL